MSLKRLLLVDDEEPFTRLVKLNLEQTGRYTVRIENDGAKALATAREFAPDLILLDVIMPDAGRFSGGAVLASVQSWARSASGSRCVGVHLRARCDEHAVASGRPGPLRRGRRAAAAACRWHRARLGRAAAARDRLPARRDR